MPSKARRTCMDKDDLIWEKLDERVDGWLKIAQTSDVYRSVAQFIIKYRPGKAVEMHRAFKGGYNVVYRLEYEDGTSAIMRIPIKDVVPAPFHDEKVRYEVAVMRYVGEHTAIPVPRVYHYGTAADNPLGLGPFIIMDYIEHYETLSGVLRDPDRPVEKRPILNPNIDENRLAFLYEQVANVLLQLDALRFPRIGSLVEDAETGKIEVKGRPLLANMIDLAIHTDMPPEGILPPADTTYADSNSWFAALADMHMAQLVFQHRDAVEDADDARDKYVARQLFRRVATQGHYSPDNKTSADSTRRAISLYSEDLRPANILLDREDRIVGVIDWEFAYAAPLSFSSAPPWWLLMEDPESWSPGGVEGWQQMYGPRLDTFLAAMERVESRRSVPPEAALSTRMRNSWNSKMWMRNYASRRSWAFDFLWWKHLDEGFFGPNKDQDHKARLAELPSGQRQIMEELVQQKLKEEEDKDITVWSSDDTVSYFQKYLL
ncbi:hypothetical protein SCUCBS95973_008981 [Sporothrix curviconia]|uniref:Protein kinase domain-containing protein n=1 Tax=Sporothrix curviconia TaxID=1260050 RepID=A0ABP0CSK9_9PEZI